MASGLFRLLENERIAHGICRGFCFHCLGDVVLGDWRRPRDGMRDLRSLCLTSRALRQIAQPYLFHRIETVNGWRDLEETLLNKPELGQYVQQLFIPRGGSPISVANGGETMWDLSKRPDAMVDWMPLDRDMGSIPDRKSLEQLLGLMPGLELCSVPLCQADGGQRRVYLQLPRVRTLRLAGGWHFSSMVQRTRLGEMLRACPQLDWLVLEGPLPYRGLSDGGIDWIDSNFSRLRTLQLEHVMLRVVPEVHRALPLFATLPIRASAHIKGGGPVAADECPRSPGRPLLGPLNAAVPRNRFQPLDDAAFHGQL